ncbi:MAG: serine/threonine protein kinase [Deltaproteobacteria bacterium]|nr:serine/threonine protein kinase [Deltaproteobacteria bacterium]
MSDVPLPPFPSQPSLPTPESLVGLTFGSYRIVKLLGAGGMGMVYEGLHPVIGARVAIKVLNPEVANNTLLVERFFNEARAVNLIGHKNLVKILDMSRSEGRYFLVMELLTGRPLQALLTGDQRMSFSDAVPILLQATDALQAAHDRQIIHRDVKPDNIFLVEEPGQPAVVKLVDFGIAKLAGEISSNVKTAAGVVMGTPAYMSPEQAEGAQDKLDGRSDIYSLGVVLFQMLCGRLPFTEPTHVKVMMAHLTEAPPRPRSLVPGMPQVAERIILRCLAKEREDRYQSMRELHDALAEGLKEADEEPPPAFEIETDPSARTINSSPKVQRLAPPSNLPKFGSGAEDEPLPGSEMFESPSSARRGALGLRQTPVSRPAVTDPSFEVEIPAVLTTPARPLANPQEDPLELDESRMSSESAPDSPRFDSPGFDAPRSESPGSDSPGAEPATPSRREPDAPLELAQPRPAAPAPEPDAPAPKKSPLPKLIAVAASLAIISLAAKLFLDEHGPKPPAHLAAASDEPAQVAFACPKAAAHRRGPTVELNLLTSPIGAPVIALWDPEGCAAGVTPLLVNAPANAKVHVRYQLPGHAVQTADADADSPHVVLLGE